MNSESHDLDAHSPEHAESGTFANGSAVVRQNPYVGPVPFREGQTLYGREEEAAELADLLISKRIVLLFGPSGAGKTSLLQAVLIPRLRTQVDLHALPIVRLTHRIEATADDASVNRYTLSTMRSLERAYPPESQLTDDQLSTLSLSAYIERRVNKQRADGTPQPQLLVIDQFEELFMLDQFDWAAKKEFLVQLGGALAGTTDHVPALWALISMREDRVAELQPFRALLPTACAFTYRLDPLERDAALEAIQKPASGNMSDEAAGRLVDDLRTMRVRTPDGKEIVHLGRFIEPVQLQVVCRRLWDVVVTKQHRPIALEDVTASSDASQVDRALRDYFDEEVDKAAQIANVPRRVLRDWIEDRLITAGGIRTQTMREPKVLAKINDAVDHLIEAHLIRSDVRNDREWIELAHDRLVEPVSAANKAWRHRNLQVFQQQARLYADSGRTHKDMLLSRQELRDAERFAGQHGDELNDDERQFLEESRRAIAAKDKSRRRLIWGLGVGSVICTVALVLFGAFVSTKFEVFRLTAELEQRETLVKAGQKELEDRQRLFGKLGVANQAGGSDAIRDLLSIEPEIARRPPDVVSQYFDLTLRTTLSGISRSIVARVGQHTHIVRSLVFTADGKHLISGSWDGSISMWNPDKPGTLEAGTGDQNSQTYSIALHEASGLLASGYLNGNAILWRLTGGNIQKVAVLKTGYHRQLTTVAFSASGKLLATAGWDKTVLLWDVSRPGVAVRIASFGKEYHNAGIQRVLFLPSDDKGERLVSLDLNGRIRIWRITGTRAQDSIKPGVERDFSVKDVLGRDVSLYGAAASPNGRFLVAGDYEGYVYVWDLDAPTGQTQGIRLTKARHGGDDSDSSIYGIAFSPDGIEFVTVGLDQAALRWTLPTKFKDMSELNENINLYRLGQMGERLFSVAYHPSRAGVIAVGGTRTIRLVDMERHGSLLATALVPDDRSRGRWRAVSMDRTFATIAGARDNGPVLFWRRKGDSYAAQTGWTINRGKALQFALQPDGGNVLTVSCDGDVTNWQLSEDLPPVPTSIRPPRGNTCPPTTLSLSSDGKVFALGLGPLVEVWTRKGDAWHRSFRGELESENLGAGELPNAEAVRSLAFSAGPSLLAIGSNSGRIRLLEFNHGEPAPTLRRETADAGTDVLSLAFNPQRPTLISGGGDGLITEWQLPNLTKQSIDARQQRSITSVGFALRTEGPAGPHPVLITADRAGNIREWTDGTPTGMNVLLAPASNRSVRSLALSADGMFMVTAADELLAWDFSRKAMLRAARGLASASNQ